jgi:hypothetical protein
MASQNFYRLLRGVRSICLPITTVIGLTLILTYVFILYRPGRGPGLAQKMGWQSWEVISIPNSTNNTHPTTTQPPHDHEVDWWNVSKPDDKPTFQVYPLTRGHRFCLMILDVRSNYFAFRRKLSYRFIKFLK